MHITLTSELNQLVQNKIASGLYTSEEEVVLDALRRMDSVEQMMQELKLARLREALAPGLAQFERGEFAEFSMEELIAESDREFGNQ